ncbi:hypothetical protein ADK67_39920 [Saccharothrix sp. NRRL B-16348]|uniref:hypothetical protein n=1 Tax=Saccharothrix sp. NRRL B-16348 TaxID=1415542 RepID=UPI0006ADE4FA|nr:hypothetical protein [Saccharothrix sp. NRRL B-16348]KOX16851.1 hypothetical protein ADK67_39920 [Saccharothrix sp. NRRL B-16348]
MRRSVVALVLAGVALAGCAERTALPAPTLGPVVDDSATLITSLAARADEQRSVRFEAETTMTGLRVTLDGGLLRAREGRLVSLRQDSSTEVVVLADAGYSRADGGTWTRLDLADRAPVRADTTVAGLADEVDPASVVEALAGSLLVKKVEEELDGVPTRRYTLLVDLHQQAERTIDSSQRAQLMAAYESGFTASATVWVGPGDLPVRVEQVLKTLEDNVFQRTLHRFTDWNADIRVSAPTS